MHKIISAGAVLLLSTASAFATGPTGTRTFQGLGFLETVNSTCSSIGFSVGNYYTAVYRFKVDSTATVVDALNLFSERTAFHILANNSTGSLAGATATTNAYVDSYGGLTTNLASTTSLTINSGGPTPLSSANNVKMVGTIDNFQNNAGCSVTLHAQFVLRPD